MSSAPYMWDRVRLNIFHVGCGGPSASGFGFAPVRWFAAEEVVRPWFCDDVPVMGDQVPVLERVRPRMRARAGPATPGVNTCAYGNGDALAMPLPGALRGLRRPRAARVGRDPPVTRGRARSPGR